jgi:hypothetical protein
MPTLPASLLPALLLGLAAIGCRSQDPRLPEKLYEDALALNKEGSTLEARALMEEIVRRYPERPEGMSARQDIFMLDAMLGRSEGDEKKQVRHLIRLTCDALARYRDRHGEYPASLSRLVPDYGLEQAPLTPWKHPLLYRPFVSAPAEQAADRRARGAARGGVRFDSYYLACLGRDMAPGGEGANADTLVIDGRVIEGKSLPPVPEPQPVR